MCPSGETHSRSVTGSSFSATLGDAEPSPRTLPGRSRGGGDPPTGTERHHVSRVKRGDDPASLNGADRRRSYKAAAAGGQTTDRARHPACAKVMYALAITHVQDDHSLVSSRCSGAEKATAVSFLVPFLSLSSPLPAALRRSSISAPLCVSSPPVTLTPRARNCCYRCCRCTGSSRCTQVYMLPPAANQRRPATLATASSPPPVVLARRNEDRMRKRGSRCEAPGNE